MMCEELIREYTVRSREILGGLLTGIYLHGSYVMGCFNPLRSDIDIIVVVSCSIPDDIGKAYMDMVADLNARGPFKGIEMSIVRKDVCDPFIYPTPFELHFSVMHLQSYLEDPYGYVRRMKGTDADLAAHFTVIRKRGKCLYGLPVEEVFGEVPAADYMDSIWKDICGAEEEICDDTMYLTLNLARVLAYKREGIVLSKKEGGEWALQNVPSLYHGLIRDALKEYTEGTEVSYDGTAARDYASFMLNEISL